jgi:hypothetical protein
MLISHRLKVIFIHIQKTGGSSIEDLLRRVDADAILTPPMRTLPLIQYWTIKAAAKFTGEKHWRGIAPICEGRHLFACHLRALLPKKIWRTYFKFAFVRNPWDRIVSWYAMVRRKGPQDNLWKYALENSHDFNSFLKNCTGDIYESPFRRRNFFRNQWDYISDLDGSLMVDFVGRFENLANDTMAVFKRIKVPTPSVIPHLNQGSHGHYREFYTEKTKDLLGQRFSKDIEFLGYRF